MIMWGVKVGTSLCPHANIIKWRFTNINCYPFKWVIVLLPQKTYWLALCMVRIFVFVYWFFADNLVYTHISAVIVFLVLLSGSYCKVFEFLTLWSAERLPSQLICQEGHYCRTYWEQILHQIFLCLPLYLYFQSPFWWSSCAFMKRWMLSNKGRKRNMKKSANYYQKNNIWIVQIFIL